MPAHQVDDGDVSSCASLPPRRHRPHAPRRGAVVHRVPHLSLARACRPERGLRSGLSRARGLHPLAQGRPDGAARPHDLGSSGAPRSTPRSNSKSPTPSSSRKSSPFPESTSCIRMSSPASNQRVADLCRCAARGGWRRRCAATRACLCSVSTSTTTRRSRARPAGWSQEFGPERVFGTPLSEDAMTGVAIGAAMAGHAADPRSYPHGLSDAGDEPARQHRRQDAATCTAARSRCRWSCAA